MTTTELAVVAVASVGVLVMLISAIGLLRLPDVYTRMHVAGQAVRAVDPGARYLRRGDGCGF